MDTSTNQHCSESLIASKRLWCGGLVANTRSFSGTKAAAICGFGEWRVDSRSFSSIGAPIAEPAEWGWVHLYGGLFRSVLRMRRSETPPAHYRGGRPHTPSTLA